MEISYFNPHVKVKSPAKYHRNYGIQETMTTPLIDQREVIGWIIYPYDTIMSDTDFYKATYKIDGIVFASDGAGNPFVIKPNGSIVCFTGIDCEETEVANSLSNFFQL